MYSSNGSNKNGFYIRACVDGVDILWVFIRGGKIRLTCLTLDSIRPNFSKNQRDPNPIRDDLKFEKNRR